MTQIRSNINSSGVQFSVNRIQSLGEEPDFGSSYFLPVD